MPSEQGRLTFIFHGNTFVRKVINFDDLGARLRDEVYIELALLCRRLDIKIFSLEGKDGTWPLEENAAAVPGHEIKYSRSLFPNTKSEGRVHFRVEVNQPLPLQFAPPVTLPSKIPIVSGSPTSTVLTLPTERFPLSPYAKHRLHLNQALAKIRRDKYAKQGKMTGKRRRDSDDEDGIASSSLEWEDVKNIYDPLMREEKAAFPVKKLDEKFLEKLVTMRLDRRNEPL